MPPRAQLALVLLGWAGAAWGQVAASLRADSDFLFRGLSLSNGKPDVSLSVEADEPSGWYAGASGTAVAFDSMRRHAAVFADLGYARRSTSSLSWELGASLAHFDKAASYDYGETFAGLLGQRWNVRVHLSPSYFGSGVRTGYAELNAGLPLSARWRLSGHLGALTPLGGNTEPVLRRTRGDARAGIGLSLDACELQAAWVATTRGGVYPTEYVDRRQTGVLSAACFF